MKYRLIPRVSLSYIAATFAPLVANTIDPTPTVVTGQVDFTGLDTHSAFINQATQKAIVDYSYFNIPEGGSVQFNQPNSNAAILNRITGADPSLLNGTLTANGQVFFVNPAGVTFGANSVIRADVFMAAAGQMSNEDFLNNIQNFSLTGNVENLGSIQTENEVGLFGQQVVNNGEIVSKNGYAIVASGDEIHVRQGGTGLTVDVTDAAEGSKNGIGIQNLGTVDGEEVMFSAGDAFATAIQQSGTVKARKSAKILSDGGVVDVSGGITARDEAGQGGRIEVGSTDLGADPAPVASQTTITETAVLDASSDSGDGGNVVVYSVGHTQFDGSADASSGNGNGGSLEVSGKTLDFENIERISLGSNGDFIINLEEITIDTDTGNPFNASAIETQLDSGSNFLVKTEDRPSTELPGDGNINVNASIQVPTNNNGKKGSLTFDADGDIIVAGGVTVENLQEDFASGQSVFDFKAGGNIILNGDVRHSGINSEEGRGTISMAAGGEVLLNNTIIDANGGSVIIDAQKLTLSGLSSGILSGFTNENTAKVDITATNEVNFAGGNIQTFGGSDIFIDTGLLTNNTGSSAIARTDLAESFFGIRLPAPQNNGLVNNASNHVYGGIQSGARALFNVTEFDTVKTNGITGNQYYYNLQPTVGITAKDGSKVYGNVFNLLTGGPAVSVDTTDFVQVPLGNPFLQDTTANALDISGVTTTSAGELGDADAGTHGIIANGAASNNGYSFVYTKGILTVDPRAITLTANEQEKTYGDPHVLVDDKTFFTVTDLDGDAVLPNGEVVTNVTINSATGVNASTTSDVTTYTDEIVISSPVAGTDGSGDGFLESNYDITYVAGDLTVNRRAITLTATEQEKTYGDQLALDDTVFTILDKDRDAVLPNGEVVTNVTINSATGADASTTSDVATYADEIEISGPVVGTDGTGDGFLESNYDISYVAGDLTVNRRAAQIIASAQEKDYGDVHDLGDTAFTVEDRDGGALPNGETVNTVTLVSENGIDASTTANAVLYADNISVTPTSTNDPTITGSANFNQENYTFSYDTADLTVNRRAAQIIASAQEKDYGDVHDLGDTAFTVVDRDGGALPNDETVNTVTLVSENGIDASTDANAVLYADNISVTPTSTNDPTITGSANFNQENYTFSYDTGDLTVNRRAITLTANEQEKIYGDQLTLDNTVFTTLDKDGDAVLPNGEVVTNVTIDSATGVDASTSSDVATYADEIVISGPVAGTDGTGDGFLESNYDITYVAGDLTVNRRAAQIIASAQEKDYGDVHDLGDTAFTVVDRDGGALPNGETVNTVTLVSENGINASTDANAVLYADNISVTPTSTNDPTIAGSANFNQENYTFSYGTGDLTVNRRAAKIIASAQEKDYGDVHDLGDTAFTVVDRDGGALPNDETVNTVTLVSENGIDASTDANAVLYADNISVTPTSTNDPTITGSANFNQENYTFSYGTGDLTINRRAITLTANEQEKTYGDQLALDDTVFTTLDKDGDAVLPNGEVVTNVTINSATGVDAATSSDVATYADEIVISGPVAGTDGTGDGFLESNYDITYVAGDLNVNRRAAQIIASAQEKDYGDVHDLGDTAFTVVDRDGGALPNGETVNTVTLVSENGIDASTTANAVLYADNISVTPTGTNDPTITGSANFNQENYTFSYDTGDLTVNRRAAQIIASAQEKDYGDVHDLGDTAFTVIDRDGGALPNSETVNTVTLVSKNGIDASTDANAVLYADNISVTPTSTSDQTIAGSANFNQENYTFSYGTGDLTINRRAITLTANEQEKTYGDQLALDDTVFTTLDKDGDAVLPNGEVVTNVTINSATGVDAATSSDVATYADEIVISGPVAGTDGTGDGFLESNYDITYVAGDLNVNRRAAQIIASAQEKDYGDVHDLGDTAFTVVDRDGGALPNGETVNTVTLVSENGIDASTTANAVLYADNISVTPTGTNDPTITGSANFNQENYTFSYDTGDLTVNRRAAQIIASAQEKDYGDVHDLGDTAFTVIDRDGGALPNSETVNTVTLVSKNGIDASTDANAVLYADNISVTPTSTSDQTIAGSANFNQENYTFSYGTGDLTINRRAITLTANEQEKTYGDQLALDDTVFTTLDKDGDAVLPNGEVVTNVTINSATGVDAATSSDVATYADEIVISGPVAGTDGTGDGFLESNYDITYVAGDLNVNRRAAQIIASAQEKDYGDVHDLGDTAFTVVDRDGGALPNGETVNTVTLVSENGIDASTTANAVLYADNISVTPTSTNDPTITGSANFNQENYTFSYGTGDLTVNRRAAQIIASAQEKDYGDVHDLGDTAFTVIDRDGGALPNGETVKTVTLVSGNGIDASTDADAILYADNISVTPTSTNDPTITGSANFNQENYNFSYGTGDLTVNRRAITLTANEQEKTYGDQLALDDTVFTTLDKDGDAVLPNGEVVTNVTINSATGVDASTTSDVATYADEIEISGPVAGTDGTGDGFLESNYDISYVAGDLTVNRRAAQIIASAQEKDYGDVHDLGDTAFTVVDRDGGALPNGETVNTVTLVSENGIDESTNANAVLYADNISVTPTSTNDPTITGSANFNQENYTFSYDTGDLTVNRRAAQIIASAQEKDYGDVHDLGDTAFTVVDRDGGALPNGETVNTVTLVSENGIDGSTDADVGTYADNILVTPTSTNDPTITGSANFNQENYTFSYGTADLTVNRRAITLTANEQEKTYGDQLALDDTVFTTLDKDGDAALPNGEVVTNVTINSATGVDASTTSDVSTYADEIEISGPVAGTDGTGDGFLESNYDITYVAGDLNVNRRAAQIIASAQEKDYGDVYDLGDTAFTVVDRDGGALPNGETVNTVTLVSENGIDASTTANAVLYADNISVTPTSTNDPTITGSANFDQENYTFSYDTGDLTINRRAIELVIADDDRFAGAAYQIDPGAFATIDLDGDASLPNTESIDTLNITSINSVAEDPSSSMGLYIGELDADPVSAIGSNGFSLGNFDITITPGDFKIDPYPGLPAMVQDVYFEQWLTDNTSLDLGDPFSNSYAISQSLGLRLISLDSWVALSGPKKRMVLRSLDSVPLRLQSFDLAEGLIEDAKRSNRN